jgi:pilus assembly protein Flp/PilA
LRYYFQNISLSKIIGTLEGFMARVVEKIIHPVRLLKNSRGQTLVEYGLLLILIAVVVIAAVAVVGNKANNTYSTVGSSLPQPPN